MDSITRFERFLYNCPYIDCSNYITFPGVSEQDFYYMEQMFIEDESKVCVFPFLGLNCDGIRYIDIYIWDATIPKMYTRFVMSDGMRFDEKDLERFINYIRTPTLMVDEGLFNRMTDHLSDLRIWNYKKYNINEYDRAFEHLYYASHHSGAKEILYKSGLDRIAYCLDELPSYNPIGSTPEAIIGYDIPLRLLRIMNNRDMIRKLMSEESIEIIKKVYSEFSGYIPKNESPTMYQWKYLEDLHEYGSFGGCGFKRALYNRLSKVEYLNEYEEYALYLELKGFLRKTYGIKTDKKIPNTYSLDSVVKTMKKLVAYFNTDHSVIDERILERKKSENYEYIGEKYVVYMPCSVEEILYEALEQKNCLADYVDEHANGNTTLIFIREINRPDKSYVTAEIQYSEIIEVLGKCNKMPSVEVYEFLKEYANIKNLQYSPIDLFSDYELDYLMDEHKKYFDRLWNDFEFRLTLEFVWADNYRMSLMN